MGACASVAKAMRAEATSVPSPEPPKEENPSATEVGEATTVAAEAKQEEPAKKKAEGGDDVKQENKAVEVEARKETVQVESDEPKMEAPAPLLVSEAAASG